MDDDDPGYGSDGWTQYDARSGQAKPLRADRWHCTPTEEVSDGDDVSGIRSQMWMRGRVASNEKNSDDTPSFLRRYS